ncbi:right-handed parallel beta-helix repeat-containing protein [Proteiniphilum acetatigenes]|uniref:right-handed parallel beta-helix repeat-containing protein n=1 Tax=Proteiniphilum acetatigenes TaxID=294710 RepID=UPI00036BE5A0|nr:right-handed parallel beta-helix repeat-containing protein [Proteiniphilum acetatigenes]
MKRNNIIIILGLALLCLPLHISYGQGARYTGSYKKSSTIKHVGKNNLVIEGLEISSTNSENCIALYNCENVVIKNCKFGPSVLARAIYAIDCKNITIVDCTFENVQAGLFASRSQGVKFEYNDVTNIVGKLRGASVYGSMVQLVEVSGAGNSISYNVCDNLPGQSSPEDIVNIYDSRGTAQSPILVKGNWIRGGGPSETSGGINLGDMSGAYQIAEDNILVDPGQYGIGISGGNDMTLRNNKVFGKRQSFTNVGITACNWYEDKGRSYNITVSNNTVNFIHKNGYTNNSWSSSNVGTISGWSTNKYDPSLSASILPTQIIGRARSSSPTPPSNPGGGTTPLPDDKPDTTPTPTPEPENPGNNNQGNNNPDTSLPNIKNDPSIQIYLDKYNRVCVNVQGTLISSTAEIIGANSKLQVIYRQPLTRFHTVLPNRPSPGNYTILVRNGDKAHLKTLYVP